MIAYDIYLSSYWTYQFFLVGASWVWGYILPIEMVSRSTAKEGLTTA
jgi:hypothetical protein